MGAKGRSRKAAHAGKNIVGRLCPSEWSRRFVVGFDEFTDGALKLANAEMRTSFDLSFAQEPKPTLDLIHPRRVRGREVQVVSRMAKKPSFDERGLVGGVVVQHQVHLNTCRDLRVDHLEKLFELQRAVAPKTLADDVARCDVQRSKQ